MQLLFDFDGILIDSSAETGFTAYRLLTGEDVRALDDLPLWYRKLFAANRCWARKAHQIVGISRWCLEQQGDDAAQLTRTEAARWLETSDNDAGTTEQRFFETRMQFVARFPEEWLSLHLPYEPLWSRVQALTSPPLILTSKNRAAVLALCEHFGLHVPAENLFSGDNFTSKATNIRTILTRLGGSAAAFLDDSLDNLLEVRSQAPAITPLLGSWGYSPEEDLERAAVEGVRVLSIDEMVALIDGL